MAEWACLLRLAGGRRRIRPGGLRLGDGLLRPAGLPARDRGGTGLAVGADLDGRHAFTFWSARSRAPACRAASALRRPGRHQGWRPLAWLGVLGWAVAIGALAALRRDLAQRRGLGCDERGCTQFDRLALVRAHAPGRARDGVQWREHRRRHFLAVVGGRDRRCWDFRPRRRRSGSSWRSRCGCSPIWCFPGRRSRWDCRPTATDPARPRVGHLAVGAATARLAAVARFHVPDAAAGMALGLFAQIGLVAHLFSLLVPALGAQQAGLAMGLVTALAIGGVPSSAGSMPRGADRRFVACASYAAQLAGSLVFIAAAGTSVPLLLLGVILFGIGFGNATSLPPLIAQVEFVDRRRAARGGPHRRHRARRLCVRTCRLRPDQGIRAPRCGGGLRRGPWPLCRRRAPAGARHRRFPGRPAPIAAVRPDRDSAVK